MLTVPNEAPFTGSQRMWLKGYLAGLSSIIAPAAPAPVQAATIPKGSPVTIAWGSQTGTAESLAKKLYKSLSTKGHSPTLIDMANLQPNHFQRSSIC